MLSLFLGDAGACHYVAASTPLSGMSDWAFSSLLGHTLSKHRCISVTINRCDLVIKQGGGGRAVLANEDADKYKFVSKIGRVYAHNPLKATQTAAYFRGGVLVVTSTLSASYLAAYVLPGWRDDAVCTNTMEELDFSGRLGFCGSADFADLFISVRLMLSSTDSTDSKKKNA